MSKFTEEQLEFLEKYIELGEDEEGLPYISSVKCSIDGDFWGDIEGDVVGNIDGKVYGNIEGDVRGNIRGTVRGCIEGDVWGDVCGNVWGDVHARALGVPSLARSSRNSKVKQEKNDK